MLAGNSADALFATLGFMIAARIVTNTTGRRPLLTDYMLVGVLATVLSGSVVGWVAGFSIAVARSSSAAP